MRTLTNKAVSLLTTPFGTRLVSLVDQGAFSLATLLVTLVLVRRYSVDEFAAYGLGLFATLMLSGAYRASLPVPVALWSVTEFARRRRALAALHLFVIACCIGLLSVALLVLEFVSLGGFPTLVVWAFFGSCLTYLSLDIDRIVLFRLAQPWQILLFACGYSAAICVAAATFVVFRPPFSVAMLMLFAIASGKTLLVQSLCGRPNLWHARMLWARLAKTTMRWNSVGSLSASMFLLMPQWVLGVVSTHSQVAGFTAVRTPMQPLMVLIRSLDIVDKVASGKLDRCDHLAVRRHYRRIFGFYVVVAATFCFAVMLLAPEIITLILGTRYVEFTTALRITAVLIFLYATAVPLETIVYQRKDYKNYALCQMGGALVACTLSYPLARSFGANGAVLVSIVGWIIPYGYLLVQFRAVSASLRFKSEMSLA